MTVAPPAETRKGRLLHPEFSLEQRIREAAAVIAEPRRGKVIELARRHGVSRQTASSIVSGVRRACIQVLAPRAAGRPRPCQTIVVDPERITASVVTLAVEAHASNAATAACIETILGQHVSTGRISAILRDTADLATRQLQAAAMPAQPVFAAADEIYDHGQPILAVIEDQHLAVLLASKEDAADATTWGVRLLELQERGLGYDLLVKDQGAGMAAGIAEAGVLPPERCGTDVFHCLLAFGREARALAHQAARAATAFEKQQASLEYLTAPAHGRGRPPQPTTLEAYDRAASAAAAAATRAAAADVLFHETRALLQPVDGSGLLISPAAAQADLAAVAELLGDLGPRCRPLTTLIRNAAPGLQAFRPALAQRYADLCARHGADLVQFVAWTWVHRQALREFLPRTDMELRQRWGVDAPLPAVAEIWHCLRNSHRASSVIESFNSGLRLHIQAHRGLTASLLPLLVYRHNVRAFPRGLHRGEAPFVALGVMPPDPRPWIEQLLHPAPAPASLLASAPSPHDRPAQSPAEPSPQVPADAAVA
jgi:hypothetical protein